MNRQPGACWGARTWARALALVSIGCLVGCTSAQNNAVAGGTRVAADRRVEIALGLPDPITIEKLVRVPDPKRGEVGADVMFVLDVSNSFRDDLKTFRQRAIEVVERLNGSYSDVRVGLATFLDAPCHGFGRDAPAYQLLLPLNENAARFDGVLAEVDTRRGGDSPEGQLEAMHQAITGAGRSVSGECEPASIAQSKPGWKTGRLPFLVLGTDAPFHDPGDTGRRGAKYPYPTSFDDVVSLAEERGVTVFVLDSGKTDDRAKSLTERTRGQVFPLASDSAGVVEAIGQAMQRSTERAEVVLRPKGDSQGFVQRIDPERIRSVDLSKGRELSFRVTFKRTVQPTDQEQVFRFQLELKINQASVTSSEVVVTVPRAS